MNETSSFVTPDNPYPSHPWERHGGFILYFLLMCYIFVGFELLCDAFFVPGLNLLCEMFHITKDFAGATLMGIGGNLPDIFSGIIGVCVLNTDVGPGSIVGSMLFNHLCIVGCTVLVVGNIKISVKSITREVTFYVITVVTFLLVLLDQKIELWESILLIMIYVIYVVVCGLTQIISKKFKSLSKKGSADEYAPINNEGGGGDDEIVNYGINDTVNSQRYKNMKEMFDAENADEDDELAYEREIYDNYSVNSGSGSTKKADFGALPPKEMTRLSSSPVYILPNSKRQSNSISPKPGPPSLATSVVTLPPSKQSQSNSNSNSNIYNTDDEDVNNYDNNDTTNNNNGDDSTYKYNVNNNYGNDEEYDYNYGDDSIGSNEGNSSSSSSSRRYENNNLRVQESIQRKKENKDILVSTHSKVFSLIVEQNEGQGEEIESGSKIGLNYGKVQMHGFLYKKSRYYSTMSISSRVWQKRWFVLDETLWYCRNPLYIDKRKELPLWKAWKISLNKEDPCSVEIYTKKETYVLRAEEEENARRWMRELKSRVKTVKRMHPELYTAGGLIDVEDEDDYESLLEFPYDASIGHIIMWIISLPFAALFTFTIPDIKRERLQKFLPLTFLMVVVWLGGMSYAMVWGAKNFARVLHIPDDIMGISITAIGASLPSLFSSVIAARQGEGNMAISNAFGSNLTALLALGLPCFIYSSMMHPGKPYLSSSSVIFVTVAALFIAIFVFVVVVLLWRLTLKRGHGAFFLLLYAVLLAGVILCRVFNINFVKQTDQ